jgi:hypothetical protein
MTTELRLVLIFATCVALAYMIGAEHGRAAYKRSAEKNGGDGA